MQFILATENLTTAMSCACLSPLWSAHIGSTEVCRRSCVLPQGPPWVPDSASFVLSVQRTLCLSCWSRRSTRPLEWRTVDTPSKVAPTSESAGSRMFTKRRPEDWRGEPGGRGRNSVCPLCCLVCLQKNDLAALRNQAVWFLDWNKLQIGSLPIVEACSENVTGQK